MIARISTTCRRASVARMMKVRVGIVSDRTPEHLARCLAALPDALTIDWATRGLNAEGRADQAALYFRAPPVDADVSGKLALGDPADVSHSPLNHAEN